jgi:hypothetical protein
MHSRPGRMRSLIGWTLAFQLEWSAWKLLGSPAGIGLKLW